MQNYRDSEAETEGSSFCWLTPHMALIAGTDPSYKQEPRVSGGSSTWVQGLKRLDYLLLPSQADEQEVALKVKHPGLKIGADTVALSATAQCRFHVYLFLSKATLGTFLQ